MATVESWFPGFAIRHVERFPRGDWPGADSSFWAEFQALLVRHGVTEAAADDASRLLFLAPPGFVSDHPVALLAKVREVWRSSQVPTVPTSPGAAADHARWNAAAAAHWASLAEAERDEWRALVLRRATFFAKTGKARELLAQAWAYDPSWVIDDPGPEPEAKSRRGPRRVFEPAPAFVPHEASVPSAKVP